MHFLCPQKIELKSKRDIHVEACRKSNLFDRDKGLDITNNICREKMTKM